MSSSFAQKQNMDLLIGVGRLMNSHGGIDSSAGKLMIASSSKRALLSLHCMQLVGLQSLKIDSLVTQMANGRRQNKGDGTTPANCHHCQCSCVSFLRCIDVLLDQLPNMSWPTPKEKSKIKEVQVKGKH